MTKLFTQNKKIKKSSNDKYIVYNFGLPAYRSRSGFKTCPLADDCVSGCYANQGTYIWSNVVSAYEYRLKQSQRVDFVEKAVLELVPLKEKAKKQKKQLVIRIHDSGDFYSLEYLKKWIRLIKLFPVVKFYTYTKMVPLYKRYVRFLPNNLIVIYSEGGVADRLIDRKKDRHARVFSSREVLKASGYVDASQNDLVAAFDDNKKIGLVYHGAKKKQWATG